MLQELGHLEASILKQVWDFGRPVQITEVHKGRADLSYSTVRTVMHRLIDKGYMKKNGSRTHSRYSPTFTRDGYSGALMAEGLKKADNPKAALHALCEAMTEQQRQAARVVFGGAADRSLPLPTSVALPPAAPAAAVAVTSDTSGALTADYDGEERDARIRGIFEQQLEHAVDLSKVSLARQLGLNESTIRNWIAHPTKLDLQRLTTLVEALELNPPAKATVYALAGHTVPVTPLSIDPLRAPEVELYQQMVDGSAHPSVVYTAPENRVVAYNAPFAQLFAESPYIPMARRSAMPLHNTLGYILGHPYAYKVLGCGNVDYFRDYWLMPALAQHVGVRHRYGENPVVQRHHARIMASPSTARAYDMVDDWMRRNGGIAVSTAHRPIYDARPTPQAPQGRPRLVRLLVQEHPGFEAYPFQQATFIFTD